MRKNNDFEIVNISGEYIAVPLGETAVSFHGVVTLNEAAALLLNKMTDGCTKEDLVEILFNEYEADRASLEKDVDSIMKSFIELGLIIAD